MTRPAVRALLAAAVLALGGLVATPSLAPAAAAACSGTSGVTVVIGSSIRCATGDPASGMAALKAVATVVQVQRQPGFVCRIDGAPASDPCVNTPPASAYWSYWHAKPGGTWQYSSLGAASYDPKPGTVEGWAFGSGQPPSSRAPKAAAAPAPTTPAPAPSATSTPPPPGSGGGGGGSAPAPSTSTSAGGGSVVKPSTRGGSGRTATVPVATSAAAAAPSAAASTPVPSTTTATTAAASTGSGSSSGTGSPSGTGEQRTDAAPVRTQDGGTSLSPVLGGALVLALAAAAGLVAWRRRANG